MPGSFDFAAVFLLMFRSRDGHAVFRPAAIFQSDCEAWHVYENVLAHPCLRAKALSHWRKEGEWQSWNVEVYGDAAIDFLPNPLGESCFAVKCGLQEALWQWELSKSGGNFLGVSRWAMHDRVISQSAIDLHDLRVSIVDAAADIVIGGASGDEPRKPD